MDIEKRTQWVDREFANMVAEFKGRPASECKEQLQMYVSGTCKLDKECSELEIADDTDLSFIDAYFADLCEEYLDGYR